MPDQESFEGKLSVVDRPDDARYELHLADEVVGLATYDRRDDVVTIPHVETAPRHRGNGFAAVLMSGIVDDVRARGLKIRPLCPYAAGYMHDDASTHDLIAD